MEQSRFTKTGRNLFLLIGCTFILMTCDFFLLTNSETLVLESGLKKTGDLSINTYSITDTTLVIAHRGASLTHPENTISAIQEAIYQQSDMVEIDIQFSKDHIPVIIHDDSLGRTTNSQGYVKDYTLEELQKLDVGSWFSEEFQNEKIPSLEEALRISKNKISVLIELKSQQGVVLTEKERVEIILDIINDLGMNNYVSIFSQTGKMIAELNKLDGTIPRGLYINETNFPSPDFPKIFSDFHLDFYVLNVSFLNEAVCEKLSLHNINYLVGPVDDKIELSIYKSKGCNFLGVLTDDPSKY